MPSQHQSREVVIPAGGTISADYEARIGTPYRALAPMGLARKPVMQIVVDALRESGYAQRIIAVAPPSVATAIHGVDSWLPSGNSGPENILRGLAQVTAGSMALVCTSDLPLMTSDSVRHFIELCQTRVEITLGIIEANAYHQAYPKAPPSEFVALRDTGPVTMACLFQVDPSLLARHQALLDRVFGARKSQWRMAGLLGPRLLWQWATQSLSLQALTAHAEKRLDCRVSVLRGVSPDLCFDIDTADDYTYAHTEIDRRAANQSGPPV